MLPRLWTPSRSRSRSPPQRTPRACPGASADAGASADEGAAAAPSGFALRVRWIGRDPLPSRLFRVHVEASDTIGDVKTKIQNMQGIPVDQQTLGPRGPGRYYEDGRTLSDYGLDEDSVITLVLWGPRDPEYRHPTEW